jgi:hypothetical protein
LTSGQKPLGGVTRLAGFPKPNVRVDADGQGLLFAVKTIGETPSLRSVWRDPKLQSTAVAELDDIGAGLGVADL